MADNSAEFDRPDLFSDALLAAPMQLSKGMDHLALSIDNVRKISMEVNKVLGSSSTIQEAKKAVEGLSQAEIELNKVTNQLVVIQAKQNDEWVEAKKKLDAANRSLKEKTTLGDRDAKSVNAQNASYKVLEAALVKNKNAYKELSTAEARASKEGKELLKIIQSQDKEIKELGKSMGEAQKNVGNYGSALEGLDGVTGGLVGNFRNLGKQFLALATNPFVLTLAVIIGLFKALQSAVTTYYETTVEGEEAAARQGAVWEAFFITLKRGWAGVGKAVSDAIGEDGAEGLLNVLIARYLPGLSGIFAATVIEAKKLAALTIQLRKDILRDIVDDARTELLVNEQLEKSKDKLRVADEQRLQAIREVKKLREAQLKGDIDLAELALQEQEQRIRELGGQIAMVKTLDKATGQYVETRKLIADYTNDEILALHVEGEEQKKLADLQAARLKVESDASAQRKALSKQEIGIFQEIEKAQAEIIRREQDASRKNYNERLEASIQNSEDIIKNQKLSAKQEIAIQESIGTERIELIKNQQKQEGDAIRRAAEDRNKEKAQVGAFNALPSDATSGQLIAKQNEILAELLKGDETYLKEKDTLNMKYGDLLIQENKRIQGEILKINIDTLKKETAAMSSELDAQVQLIKDQAIKGNISKQQAEKEIADIQKKLSDDYIKLKIDEVRKTLALKGLSVDEQEKLEKELYDLQVKYQDALYAQVKNKYEDEIKFLQGLQQVFGDFTNAVGGLVHSLTERRLQDIDTEQKAVEKQHETYQEGLDEDLDNFIGSEEDKAAFERGIRKQKEADQKELERQQEAFEKRRIEAQKKAAIYDKAVSAIQAGIATSLAIIKMLADPGGFAGVGLSIAAGITGAAQIAAILSKPIPQFYEGGTTKGGAIIAGELGRELMKEPGGKMYLSPATATIMKDVPAGTEIFPHDQTMAMLAMAGMQVGDRKASDRESMDLREVTKGISNLTHAVKSKKEFHMNISKQGAEAMFVKSENRIKLMNYLWR